MNIYLETTGVRLTAIDGRRRPGCGSTVPYVTACEGSRYGENLVEQTRQSSTDIDECEPDYPSLGEKCATADMTGAFSAAYRSRGRGMFVHTTVIRPRAGDGVFSREDPHLVRFSMGENFPGGRPALSDMGGKPQTPGPQPMS